MIDLDEVKESFKITQHLVVFFITPFKTEKYTRHALLSLIHLLTITLVVVKTLSLVYWLT